MAAAFSMKFTPISRPTLLIRSSNFRFHKSPLPLSIINNRYFTVKIGASSTAFIDATPADPIVVENVTGTGNLACPICFDRLIQSSQTASGTSLQCNSCKKTFSGNDTHIDLTLTAASVPKKYVESVSLTTELFRLPLMSFIYERGWRQNFVWGGFPGPEKEFEMMKDYLKPVLGGNIIDASCGSGLFSRLFAKSGLFSRVVALDYSENMLQQCHEFIEKEENFPKEKVTLVRADISRLPFVSRSVDAVHAGAAIHCWPSPSTAVAEISRVLRPGGVFVGTTFILDRPFSSLPFIRFWRENTVAIPGGPTFLSERELEDICRTSGLVDFTCVRNQRFVMFSAMKPN